MSRILDHVENWQVFENDDQILNLLHNIQDFEKNTLDERDNDHMEEICANKISVGLVPLEAKFDRDDALKGRIEMTKLEEYQEINVGTIEDPKMIKAGTTTEEKEKI